MQAIVLRRAPGVTTEEFAVVPFRSAWYFWPSQVWLKMEAARRSIISWILCVSSPSQFSVNETKAIAMNPMCLLNLLCAIALPSGGALGSSNRSLEYNALTAG